MNTKLYSHRFGWLSTLLIAAIISSLLCILLIDALGAFNPSGEARRAKCLSNLKQIGLALKQYALDNNEVFPWDNPDLPQEQGRIMNFKDDKVVLKKPTMQPYQSFGRLHPSYASALEIFRCPNSKDEEWDIEKAHIKNRDNKPFTQSSCKDSLSYAYCIDKDGNGKNIQGPWTEAAASTTRIAGDKYACANYSKGDLKNQPSNHNTDGRNIVRLDGSGWWDDSKKPLEADPEKKYPDSSTSPESDQTGVDWWNDPPDKP